jgi:hypothetical protein
MYNARLFRIPLYDEYMQIKNFKNKISNSFKKIQLRLRPGVVVHSCSPSYSGGRNQENHGMRPVQEKELLRSHLKK